MLCQCCLFLPSPCTEPAAYNTVSDTSLHSSWFFPPRKWNIIYSADINSGWKHKKISHLLCRLLTQETKDLLSYAVPLLFYKDFLCTLCGYGWNICISCPSNGGFPSAPTLFILNLGAAALRSVPRNSSAVSHHPTAFWIRKLHVVFLFFAFFLTWLLCYHFSPSLSSGKRRIP